MQGPGTPFDGGIHRDYSPENRKVNQSVANLRHFPGIMKKQLPAFRELFFFCTPQFGEFHKQDLFPEIVETHYGLQVIA